MDYHDKVAEAASYVRARVPVLPDVAVVLGSGLGGFAGGLARAVTIPYTDIPHWPASRVAGHAGQLVIGSVGAKTVAALAGRAHYYEGHDMGTVVFGTRVLGSLGVKTLILTNAAGGINTAFGQGALMVIDDHINLFGSNPLIGPNDDRFGPRFPDMTEAYSKRLRAIADEVSREQGQPVAHGVYVGVHGPSYETPAEIRFMRAIGADAVGMSTVPEVIAARHMGVPVAGISVVTNHAAGLSRHRLSHQEVEEVAARVRDRLGALVGAFLRRASRP